MLTEEKSIKSEILRSLQVLPESDPPSRDVTRVETWFPVSPNRTVSPKTPLESAFVLESEWPLFSLTEDLGWTWFSAAGCPAGPWKSVYFW